jgi:hypothetical protein
MPDRRFVIVVRDKSGIGIDTSHLKVDSLDGAGVIAHAFQRQDGHTVVILDMGTNPRTEYSVDRNGKPVLYSRLLNTPLLH